MNSIIRMIISRVFYIIRKIFLDAKTKRLEEVVKKELKEADDAVKESDVAYDDFMDEYNKRRGGK